MIITARQSHEMGIADHIVEDYVNGLALLGWDVEFRTGRDIGEGVAVHFHPIESQGIIRDLQNRIPVVIVHDSIGIPLDNYDYPEVYVKNIPHGTTRDKTVDMMSDHLSALFGGRNA